MIWKNSSGLQCRGYFAASVGFSTGRKLDESAEQLNALLFEAETAIEHGDADDAINAAIQFSEIVFKIRLFTPREKLPVGWQDVLSSWMRGRPMADIVASDPEFLVDFIEDVIVYRLVWAAEAVRVRSHSHQDEFADLWTGKFAESLEVGTLDWSAVTLIHAGLGSRVAAFKALSDFPEAFDDFESIREWLRSKAVSNATATEDWPTPETAELWRSFVFSMDGGSISEWKAQSQVFPMARSSNNGNVSPPGALVRIVNRFASSRTELRVPDFTPIGELPSRIRALATGVAYGSITPDGGGVAVTYIGPGELKWSLLRRRGAGMRKRVLSALTAVGELYRGIKIPSYKRQTVQCCLREQEEFEMFERCRADFADAPGRSWPMAIKKSDLYSSLWASCDEPRGGMDASQYKDYVLFMLFIKYVTDKYGNSRLVK